MTSVPVVRDAATHIARAEAHQEAGDKLRLIENDWFAVCYFYAAYHMVKASLNVDPIFGSLTALQAVNPNLTPDVRYAEHHNGNFGANGRSLGVNEAVFHLYKSIRVPYHRLHMASCHVRYGFGLVTVSPESVLSDFNHIHKAYRSGEIVAQAVSE